MKRATVTLGLVLLMAAGCSKINLTGKSDRISFDGQTFRTSARKADDDLSVFVVKVPGATKTLTGAREAGRYEATRYCIKNFGSSKIEWIAGPDAATVTMDKDTMLLQGICKI